jgi:hypothetical protein
MDMDHEVDVFHAVKLIRINRPQLIDMKVGLSLPFISPRFPFYLSADRYPVGMTRRRATYEDVLAAPSNKVAEIIDGELHLSPRPALPHSAAASALGEELGPPFKRGRGGNVRACGTPGSSILTNGFWRSTG